MLENINVLLKRKAALKDKAEALNNTCIAASRDFTEEEKTTFDGMVADIQVIEGQLTRHAQLATFTGEEVLPGRPVIVNRNQDGDVDTEDPRASKEYHKAFIMALRHGGNALSAKFQAVLNITTPSQGGYGTSIEFDTQIVEKLINANCMRQIANVITTNNDRKIAVEASIGSADWTAESATAHNDDSSDDDSLTQVTLSAYKLTRLVKVSEELLNDAFFDVQAYLVKKFGNAFGLAEEAAFVNGVGGTRPTGVVQGALAGVTSALHNDIATDELLNMYHSLKRVYRASGEWLMNDSTALLIRKKKTTFGEYIWQPGLVAGSPDMLLGKPVYISDFMPTADNAGNKAVLFGDFDYYTIADRTPRTFLRLNELYSANGQVGFRGTERTDGKLTLPEAVRYLAMGAAS